MDAITSVSKPKRIRLFPTHVKGQPQTLDLAAMNFCLACSKNVAKNKKRLHYGGPECYS